jgi:hypothetical protein
MFLSLFAASAEKSPPTRSTIWALELIEKIFAPREDFEG